MGVIRKLVAIMRGVICESGYMRGGYMRIFTVLKKGCKIGDKDLIAARMKICSFCYHQKTREFI